MLHRRLRIGKWKVDFLFAEEEYDVEEVLTFMYDNEATYDKMIEARDMMDEGKLNTGFTYSDPYFHYALVVVGPTTSGEEFIDTLTHELLHLATEIAVSKGDTAGSETAAYTVGDSARDLSDVICMLGCVPKDPSRRF